jgi:hypothetical protein
MDKQQSSPRGLATLALLKTRFDDRCDHIGLLEPFVEDALAHCRLESFLPADIAAILLERTGLQVPQETVRVLLGRFAKRGVKREGGRYFLSQTIPDPGLDAALLKEQSAQQELAKAFVDVARDSGVPMADEDALPTLATFVAENKVPLILDSAIADSPLDRSSLPRKVARMAARFLSEHCLESSHLRPQLDSLVEGLVLRDTLLLKDLASVNQKFQKLIVALDSPILFALLDLTGIANAVAARDSLQVLRDAGAQTVAFDRTISEMRRILRIYEEHLGSTDGRLSLYPTDLTRHVLTSQLTPSDVRTISATLERRLALNGVSVIVVPQHEARYTLDEKALAAALASDTAATDADSPRVRHDVDCVAATLTTRRGLVTTRVENSLAVYCTIAGRVIRNVQNWYRGQQEGGFPPIVHLSALTSLAWIKKPGGATGVKLHELMALCAAALRPSRKMWTRFVENLRVLRQDGTLSDDETVAVVASDMTDPILGDIEEEGDPHTDTIVAAIERVREQYRSEFEQVAKAQVAAAKTEAALAAESASRTAERLARLDMAIRNRAEGVARVVSLTVFYVTVTAVLVAALMSIPGIADGVPSAAKLLLGVASIVALLLGLYSQIRGPSLADIRERCRAAVATWLYRKWTNDDAR